MAILFWRTALLNNYLSINPASIKEHLLLSEQHLFYEQQQHLL